MACDGHTHMVSKLECRRPRAGVACRGAAGMAASWERTLVSQNGTQWCPRDDKLV